MAETQTANQAIKTRLDGFLQFHPASANLFADWMLDPGDIITVKSDNTSYAVPVYKMDVNWKGDSMVEISSSGAEKRPPPSELKRRRGGGIGGQSEDDAKIKDVIYKTDFTKTDEGIGLMAKAVGVKIDPLTGKPAINPNTGKYEFDENGATLTGQINIQAGNLTAEVVQARNGQANLRAALDLKTDSASLSAVMDSNGHVTAASVVTAVNTQTGQSIVKLSGNMIALTGNVSINDAIQIDNDGELHSTYPISTTDYLKSSYLTLSGNTAVSLYPEDISTMIVKASVSGNTLNLWKRGDDTSGSPSLTFSKATTLSGAWSNGTFSYTAKQNNVTVASDSTELTSVSGANSISSNGTYTYTVMYEDENGDEQSTGLTKTVQVSVSGGTISATKTVHPSTSAQTVSPNAGDSGIASVIVQKLSSISGSNSITSNGTYTYKVMYEDANQDEQETGLTNTVTVNVSGSVPPSSHISVESGGHYSPSYSAGGTQIMSWVNTIKTAVANNGYFYFDAWITDNPSDKKRYYIKFS